MHVWLASGRCRCSGHLDKSSVDLLEKGLGDDNASEIDLVESGLGESGTSKFDLVVDCLGDVDWKDAKRTGRLFLEIKAATPWDALLFATAGGPRQLLDDIGWEVTLVGSDADTTELMARGYPPEAVLCPLGSPLMG